jgi:hypothetical protein
MNLFVLALCLTADARLDRCLLDDQPDDAALSTVLREVTPGGTVTLGPGVLILRQPIIELRGKTGEPARELNVTIRGSGNTVIRAEGSPRDVVQVNAIAGLTLRDVTIESVAVVTDKPPGANGLSLTNGCTRILIDGVTVKPLPFYYDGRRFDGGKAFSIQQGTGPDRSSVVFRNCTAVGSPIGFGVDADPNKAVPASVIIDRCHVEDCAAGVAVSFTAGPEAKGFRVDVLGSRFEDTPRPLIVSRASDVRFLGNSTSMVCAPALPDLWAANFGECAIAVKGSQRVEITGNTFCDRRPITLLSVTSATGPSQPSGVVTTEPNVISR